MNDPAHEAFDKDSEVNRILGSHNLEDIRKHGIKCLPEEQYEKAKASFQTTVLQLYYSYPYGLRQSVIDGDF